MLKKLPFNVKETKHTFFHTVIDAKNILAIDIKYTENIHFKDKDFHMIYIYI